MFLKSDNTGPAHPEILQAMVEANEGYATPYGDDPWTARAVAAIRELFEAPNAAVHLVTTGTAANSIALATLSEPWQTVFCAPEAHIQVDECNAPEFYMGGAKLTLVGDADKMTPETLRRAIEAEEVRGVHGAQRGPVSITQATERGQVYTRDEVIAIGDLCREFNLPLHMDGARFANALVAEGCTPAEMTWKAGVSAVSFGGSKNGCLGVEAIVIFDPAPSWEVELRRKRGAHLLSKHRYLGAQMAAYLEGGLWLDLATRANAARARLEEGLRQIDNVSIQLEPRANMMFVDVPRALNDRLQAAGAQFYLWDDPAGDSVTLRLVCDWSLDDSQIDAFLAAATG